MWREAKNIFNGLRFEYDSFLDRGGGNLPVSGVTKQSTDHSGKMDFSHETNTAFGWTSESKA
jgi:hypothetical protein